MIVNVMIVMSCKFQRPDSSHSTHASDLTWRRHRLLSCSQLTQRQNIRAVAAERIGRQGDAPDLRPNLQAGGRAPAAAALEHAVAEHLAPVESFMHAPPCIIISLEILTFYRK
jgi:hypothetical protein